MTKEFSLKANGRSGEVEFVLVLTKGEVVGTIRAYDDGRVEALRVSGSGWTWHKDIPTAAIHMVTEQERALRVAAQLPGFIDFIAGRIARQ